MSQFKFKQFSITHAPAVFKFGTDAALLSMGIPLNGYKNALEIGTGTGVISLVLAQRNPELAITGIDISETAIACANANLSTFKLPHNIQFLQTDLQSFQPNHTFDLIISNPPFFEQSTKSKSLVNARHTDTLSLIDLIQNSKRLLSNSGKLVFIYPSRYLNDIQACCRTQNLCIRNITNFRDTENAEIKRVIVTISKEASETTESTTIIKGAHHGYSPKVAYWFAPFYLKF